MENGWNFQGWIALPLEHYAKTYLGTTDISADSIASGKFIDTMLEILSVSNIDSNKMREFKNSCKKYTGLSYTKIPDETAEILFKQFKDLMGL